MIDKSKKCSQNLPNFLEFVFLYGIFLLKWYFIIISVPPERLTVEGPDELTPDYEARFTCKASASNLPSKLTFKLTSHHSDLLDELIDNGLVEIEEPKEKWIEQERQNDGGAPGWASSRSLILKTELLKRAAQLGEQITFECQIPDPYHERRILISATKFVTLHSKLTRTSL